ncbi:hypothetical protein [Planctellipticum variicoloris]|nr:hypothetical protein SH412_005523 [Planctomycetaceae bacterium SH412]
MKPAFAVAFAIEPMGRAVAGAQSVAAGGKRAEVPEQRQTPQATLRGA